MKVAHIVPGLNTEFLGFHKYAMCLAQFVLADDEYAQAYSRLPTDTHVIMDNGLAEEGQPLKVAQLAEAVLKCVPDEVVLPDYIDPDENIKAARFALGNEEFLSAVQKVDAQLMFVPHGSTMHEYVANVSALTTFDRLPDSFGISKFHDKMHPLAYYLGRAPLALVVKAFFPNKPLHYLGLGGPLNELRVLPFGRTVDTCYAYMAAANDITLHHQMFYRPKAVEYNHQAVLDPSRGQVKLFEANCAAIDAVAEGAGRWLEM